MIDGRKYRKSRTPRRLIMYFKSSNHWEPLDLQFISLTNKFMFLSVIKTHSLVRCFNSLYSLNFQYPKSVRILSVDFVFSPKEFPKPFDQLKLLKSGCLKNSRGKLRSKTGMHINIATNAWIRSHNFINEIFTFVILASVSSNIKFKIADQITHSK